MTVLALCTVSYETMLLMSVKRLKHPDRCQSLWWAANEARVDWALGPFFASYLLIILIILLMSQQFCRMSFPGWTGPGVWVWQQDHFTHQEASRQFDTGGNEPQFLLSFTRRVQLFTCEDFNYSPVFNLTANYSSRNFERSKAFSSLLPSQQRHGHVELTKNHMSVQLGYNSVAVISVLKLNHLPHSQ